MKRWNQKMKYLSNTIKMTLVVGVLFFGLAVFSKADDSSINQIKEVPGKVVGFINQEIAKTKEYQKEQKDEMKYQWMDTKEDFKDLFASIKGFFIKSQTKNSWYFLTIQCSSSFFQNIHFNHQ